MEEPKAIVKTIAIVGGTGKEGKGLAYRWCRAGYKVIIGSRQIEKATAVANEIKLMIGDSAFIHGNENIEAVKASDLVVLTVPYSIHGEMLLAIKDWLPGKILIDVTVPLNPPKITRVKMPTAGSAAQEAQAIVGDVAHVVSAFQNISYEYLLRDEEIACDVLVCGNSRAARQVVIELVSVAGLTGWDAGPIENSVVTEGLTSILIGINKQFGCTSAGIKITGVPVHKTGNEI